MLNESLPHTPDPDASKHNTTELRSARDEREIHKHFDLCLYITGFPVYILFFFQSQTELMKLTLIILFISNRTPSPAPNTLSTRYIPSFPALAVDSETKDSLFRFLTKTKTNPCSGTNGGPINSTKKLPGDWLAEQILPTSLMKTVSRPGAVVGSRGQPFCFLGVGAETCGFRAM